MLESYYHLAPSRATELRPGATVHFGRIQNWHYQEMGKRGFGVRSADGQKYYSMLDVAQDLLAVRFGRARAIGQPLNYHYDAMRCLREVSVAFEHTIKCLREEIFEATRLEQFPDLPSRRNCIWLIPDDAAILAYWKATYVRKENSFRVLRVRAKGRAHLADNSLLVPQTSSISQLKQAAERYWRGELVDPLHQEIVFAGEVTVVNEI